MKNLKTICLALVVLILPVCNESQAQTSTTCKGKSTALETIGSISGTLLYNTYIAIGAVADGYAEQGYEKDYCVQLMDEQINLMNLLDTSFMDLEKSGFLTSDEDIKYVGEIRVCLIFLRDYADAFKTYLNNPDESNTARYNAARDKAWAKIAELLGFEE